MHHNLGSERIVVQRHGSPDEAGVVFWQSHSLRRRQKLSLNLADFDRRVLLKKRREYPKESHENTSELKR